MAPPLQSEGALVPHNWAGGWYPPLQSEGAFAPHNWAEDIRPYESVVAFTNAHSFNVIKISHQPAHAVIDTALADGGIKHLPQFGKRRIGRVEPCKRNLLQTGRQGG